jgi:hypothetical protein
VLSSLRIQVRYGAGPSLRTANLDATVTRGFWAFTRPRVYNPFVYQQLVGIRLRRASARPFRARLDGLTDRVEVHPKVSPVPLTRVPVADRQAVPRL